MAELEAQGTEVGLDLARLAFARGGELVVDRLLQGIAGAQVANHAGRQHGDRAEKQQDPEELGRQTPAHGAGRANYVAGGHGGIDTMRKDNKRPSLELGVRRAYRARALGGKLGAKRGSFA